MTIDGMPLTFGCPMHVSRRAFLAGCAGCAAGLSTLTSTAAPAAATAATTQPAANAKPRLRLVFTHISPETPTWPNINYDYEGRKKELTARLQHDCPDIEWLPITVQNPDDAKKMLQADKDIDGYVVYMVGIWTGAARIIAESGRPTIFVDDLYAGSGEFLIEYSRAKRAGQKVTGVSSTDFQDVVKAVNCFSCIKKLRSFVILDVVDQWDPAAQGKQIQDVFGTTVKRLSGAELNQAYEKADTAKATQWADRWMKDAAKIVEPGREEIIKSGRMYLALLDLLAQHSAQAITIACLGLFYTGKMSAYPCLGFWQLNNDGFVGACEADLQSTITMLVVSTLTGCPGYISDPVVDTSKNQVIYAHCVAPTKLFGPNGPSNPYHIRSHAEDGKGAVIRSLVPMGEMTTTLEIAAGRRELLLHQGKTVANVDEPKACRTKIAVQVPDASRMITEWDAWGWHRVTFFGDHKTQIEHLARLMGLKVSIEGQA